MRLDLLPELQDTMHEHTNFSIAVVGVHRNFN